MEALFEFTALSAVFTAAGAITWGALIFGLTELIKKISFIPITDGKPVLMLVAVEAAIVVGLATWEVASAPGFTFGPFLVVAIVFTWANVTGAAVASYELTLGAEPKPGTEMAGTEEQPPGP